MSVRRRVALWGGLLAAAVGLALAVHPALLAEPDPGEWAVSLLGAIALVYAVGPLYRRHLRERTVAAGPEPETRRRSPVPGADVDELLAAARSIDRRSENQRRRLRRRLHETAVAAVERREDCTTETAREMIEAGTWTDDAAAASFFTDGPVEVPEGQAPRGKRLRLRLSGPARRAFAARRVADEVAALMEPETAADGDGRTVHGRSGRPVHGSGGPTGHGGSREAADRGGAVSTEGGSDVSTERGTGEASADGSGWPQRLDPGDD